MSIFDHNFLLKSNCFVCHKIIPKISPIMTFCISTYNEKYRFYVNFQNEGFQNKIFKIIKLQNFVIL